MPGIIAEGESAVKARKPTKNEQRRAKKKQAKLEATTASADDGTAKEKPAVAPPPEVDANHPLQPVQPSETDPIQGLPAISDTDGSIENDPLFVQYAGVVAKFKEDATQDSGLNEVETKPSVFYDDDDMIQGEDEEEETQQRLSKKARKAANKLSIAELKALVRKPEVVDWTDTSAHDPRLLVNIKSARNVVPVPSHWNLKREYLSSKRGIEKPHFTLPKFIADTGIAEMRAAVLEKQEEATLKQKQRERVSGKTGTLNMDYGKVYDAFFRFQTKPVLTNYGEVYYEGKEFETNLKHLQPGQYSDPLREALSMGPVQPPPWLLVQQKIGPPPSYPALKIPGVNAPIPPGAEWGFQGFGYGKPPVTDQGVAIWGGDLFGELNGEGNPEVQKEKEHEAELVRPPERNLWGELQPIEDVEEEEEEDEEEDEEEEAGEDEGSARIHGTHTERDSGMETTGITSAIPTDIYGAPAGELNLRKNRQGTDTEISSHPRSAGQVLNQRSIRAEGFFGGEHAYDLSDTSRRPPADAPLLGSERDERGRKRKAADVDVSVDVDAMERGDRMTKEQLQKQYDNQRAQENAGNWQEGGQQEDLSSMVAEDSAKRQKREKERAKERTRGGGGRR